MLEKPRGPQAPNSKVQHAASTFLAAVARHGQAVADLRTVESNLKSISLDVHQQELLARSTLRVVQAEQERDDCEAECAQALREFQDRQELATNEATEKPGRRLNYSSLSRSLTKSLVAMLPATLLDDGLVVERQRINNLRAHAQVAKDTYSTSLRQLDHISTAVHKARSAHDEDTLVASSLAASADSSGVDLERVQMLSPFATPECGSPAIVSRSPEVDEQADESNPFV